MILARRLINLTFLNNYFSIFYKKKKIPFNHLFLYLIHKIRQAASVLEYYLGRSEIGSEHGPNISKSVSQQVGPLNL